MDRKVFFDAIRAHIKLDQFAVDGINALLDAGGGLPLDHMANVLANVRRETGGLMGPIKETVMESHKNRNPSDAEVIRRLDNAFRRGRLPWVKTPYWRDGEFGRGQIQLTHAANRAKFGITNRDDLLKPEVSARIAVEGMSKGMFTGRKLSDYTFPNDLSNPPKTNPRRIVNGQDGSDAEVAASHRMFADALRKSGWGLNVPPPAPAENMLSKLIAAIVAASRGLFR